MNRGKRANRVIDLYRQCVKITTNVPTILSAMFCFVVLDSFQRTTVNGKIDLDLKLRETSRQNMENPRKFRGKQYEIPRKIRGNYITCNYTYMHMFKDAWSQIKSKCYQLALLITVRAGKNVENSLKFLLNVKQNNPRINGHHSFLDAKAHLRIIWPMRENYRHKSLSLIVLAI